MTLNSTLVLTDNSLFFFIDVDVHVVAAVALVDVLFGVELVGVQFAVLGLAAVHSIVAVELTVELAVVFVVVPVAVKDLDLEVDVDVIQIHQDLLLVHRLMLLDLEYRPHFVKYHKQLKQINSR